MTTITHSTGTITPEVVNGFTASREPGNIVHTVLGSSTPDVSLRPSALRAGTLELVFATAAAATAAEAVMALPQVLTITDPDVAEVGMDFVVAGGATEITLDDQTRSVWVLRVPFQEVSP